MSKYSETRENSLYITKYLLNIIKVRDAGISESRKIAPKLYPHSYCISTTSLLSDDIYLKCLLEFDGEFTVLQSDTDNAFLNYLIVRNKVIVWMLKSVYIRSIKFEIINLIDIIYKTYNRLELEKTKKLESELQNELSVGGTGCIESSGGIESPFDLELLFEYCIPDLSVQLTEWFVDGMQDTLIDNLTNFVRDTVLSNELVTFDSLLTHSNFLTIIDKCVVMHSINKNLVAEMLIVCAFSINTKLLISGSYI